MVCAVYATGASVTNAPLEGSAAAAATAAATAADTTAAGLTWGWHSHCHRQPVVSGACEPYSPASS